jgi:hypothetical protein
MYVYVSMHVQSRKRETGMTDRHTDRQNLSPGQGLCGWQIRAVEALSVKFPRIPSAVDDFVP